jgi:hypothetical protein
MEPEVHSQVFTMKDRLDLIAKRIHSSIIKPQKRKDGSQYMLRDLALEVVNGVKQHGQVAEDEQIARVFWWAKNNVEYRQDPADYDMYMTAGRTISAGGSDCDDHTILNASMLSSLGFMTGAKVISPDNLNWHIYAVVGAHPFYDPTVSIPLDTTQPSSYPGWEPPASQRQYSYMTDFKYDKAVRFRRVQ